MTTATKTKPKKAKKQKPAWNADEMRDFTKRMGDLEDLIRDDDREIKDVAQDLKAKKEMRAGRVAELRRTVFEMNHPEALPLLNGNNGHTNGEAAKGNGQPAVVHPPTGEEWKQTPVREALPDMPKAFYKLCEGKQLDTIGKLFDWKNEREDRWWKDLGKGVGKATFDKLDDAIERFLEQRKKIEDAKAKVGKPDEATTEGAK